MIRRTRLARGIDAFVDPNFLANQRPKIPGGAWTVEILRTKSMADLQNLWYVLLKERNKVLTMKHHYMRHQEELGALPAPSREEMLKDSIANVKAVLRERDDAATDKAVKIFEENVKKGVYRYPPGPQPAPGAHTTTSRLVISAASKPSEDDLRAAFSDMSVFYSHKGIISVTVTLPEEVLLRKKRAHREWQAWAMAKKEFVDYHRYADVDSVFDRMKFEIAPGVMSEGVRANSIPVPAPLPPRQPPKEPLARVKWDAASLLEKTTTQLGYFPNITSLPPVEPSAARPTHPDEIEGPWSVSVVFDSVGGAERALALGLTDVGGIPVTASLALDPPAPYASQCPLYAEALRIEESYQSKMTQTPVVPDWDRSYDRVGKRPLWEIVTHNWSNVVDYVEREARMTNQSLWEPPIKIDYTCGKGYQLPPWATRRNEWDAKLAKFPRELEEY